MVDCSYGGEVVNEFERDDVDHVICSQPSATGKVGCYHNNICICCFISFQCLGSCESRLGMVMSQE